MTETPANPLLAMLATKALPDFDAIAPEHAEPAVDALIAEAREAVAQGIAAADQVPGWEGVIEPIDAAQDRLERGFAPVAHLHSVMDSPAWREAFQACLPKLTAFSSEVGQNTALYEAVAALRDSAQFKALATGAQRVITDMLRDFKLAGVALDDQDKARYTEITQRISELSTTFQQNLLDATQAWRQPITDEAELAGLPDSAKSLLAQNAANKDLDGWLVTLDAPSFIAVMTHAENRALREQLYEAFTTRASETGPNAGEYDNSALMDEILALRYEAARLLGFANYAEVSLATKMAQTPGQIERFLLDLAARSRQPAQAEIADLRALAAADGLTALEAWDVAYYSEKLKQKRYAYSDEDLRPYFPAPAVIAGLFQVVRRLYGVSITALGGVSTWHPDVTVYEIRDADNARRGVFYLDPYARDNKRGGAWMNGFQSRRRDATGLQLPMAFVTCNFSPPIGDAPALLSHSEVTTLFHEFGHGLHHMLTQVDYAPVAGIAGLEWDAVELPSQFMENWAWARESLDLFASHYQTGAALPQELFAKLAASRNHMAGCQMLRQIEFSLFDLRVHRDYEPQAGARIQETLDEVRAEVAVLPPPAFNRFQHSFAHIFAGGYAAGYYSYKWAEVLSADAFSAFEETSLFDTATGQRFLREILERGATRDALDSFVAFRGREPAIDALLRHSGLAGDRAA
jgi:oligopeptidase A